MAPAATVSERWLHLASAPAFLRRFRGLHPPHLLGFYVKTQTGPPRFVPLPQPPELATVVRRASFDLDILSFDDIMDCWNGLLLIISCGMSDQGATPVQLTGRVRCPLYPARYIDNLPPLPHISIHDGFTYYEYEILPKVSGAGDGLSYFYLATGCHEQDSVLDVYVLQGDIWAIYSSALTEIFQIHLLFISLIVDDKIYNIALVSGIYKLVSLDLASSCLSLVNLPEEVEYMSTDLLLANDSEVHLINIKGSQLRIWHYMVDKKGLTNWLLVDTICLREICVNHMISTTMFGDVGGSALIVYAAGVNPGFLFLWSDDVLYLFDLEHRVAKKVYEVTPEDIAL
ncbi:hypothetical protein ZWY2020_000775 [Hordeum vulgare]|nr:hypothetical protein ZWY2020_000775 [Hordeum vulgare]